MRRPARCQLYFVRRRVVIELGVDSSGTSTTADALNTAPWVSFSRHDPARFKSRMYATVSYSVPG